MKFNFVLTSKILISQKSVPLNITPLLYLREKINRVGMYARWLPDLPTFTMQTSPPTTPVPNADR
jgi:hypothetical protein